MSPIKVFNPSAPSMQVSIQPAVSPAEGASKQINPSAILTSIPVPEVEPPKIRSSDPTTCVSCFGKFVWRPRGGSWRCRRCDPPMNAAMVADETYIGFIDLCDWYDARTKEMVASGLWTSAEAWEECDRVRGNLIRI